MNSRGVEIIRPRKRVSPVRCILFDFDGTLSLIREGWRTVMATMMTEIIVGACQGSSAPSVRSTVEDFIDELTGRQTIYQMFRLVEEVEKRGGKSEDALTYKGHYHRLLTIHITNRLRDLESQGFDSDHYLVAGSRACLQRLRNRSVPCFLASGTDEIFVLRESRLLGIDTFFTAIYGAQDDYRRFSKGLIMDRLIDEHRLGPGELACIGDGFVEISNARDRQALAIGVASDETRCNPYCEWKRERLIRAGADVIIGDLRCYDELIDLMCLPPPGPRKLGWKVIDRA